MVDAPDWFKAPMLCKTTLREELDNHKKWEGYIAEPKHDGTRCLAVRHAGEDVRLYSRSGQDYTDHVPALVAPLNTFMVEGSTLDGELAVLSRTVTVLEDRFP